MDPNPKNFPLVSYVLTRLHSIRNPNPNPSSTTFDIEQPQTPSSPSSWTDHVELMERMPHLSHPGLLASMSTAIADVAQTRSVLRTLGDRPDHESVDFARARISEIDAEMSRELQELVTGPRPEGVEIGEWRGRLAEREAEVRKRAAREKQGMKAVVQLDEMHEAYQVLLKEAEERLEGIYGERVRRGEEEEEEEGMVNEEVVKVLQAPMAGSVERVDLSGKKLRILPEAFGRLQGMVVLNLSGNQLEVVSFSLSSV